MLSLDFNESLSTFKPFVSHLIFDFQITDLLPEIKDSYKQSLVYLAMNKQNKNSQLLIMIAPAKETS